MGSSVRHRPSSPDGRLAIDPMRASTGTVHLSSSYDPYDLSASRYGYSAYPSDYLYATPHDKRLGRERRLEAQPISSKTYRDPGHSPKVRTEYAVRSRPRNSTISGAEVHQPMIRTMESSPKTRSPLTTSRYPRSPSPLPSESQHYLVPSSSRNPYHHRRVYSTDYASDTGRLHPSSAMVRHRMDHGAYTVKTPRTHPRYPVTGDLKKGEDVDGYDAYSYTNPREQFEKESIARVGHYKGGHRRERPVSMTGVEEYYNPLAKESRVHGPPPSQRGFGKLDREPRMHRSSPGAKDDDGTEESRNPRRYLVPGSFDQGDDDGYSSYRDDHDNSHHRRRRSRRREDSGNRQTHNDRALRKGHASDALVSDASSTGGVHKHRRELSTSRRYSESDTSTSGNEEAAQHLIVGRPRRRRKSYSRTRRGDRSPARVSSHQGSVSAQEDRDKSIVTGSLFLKEPEVPPKGILKPPRDKFPEEPNPVREGVAPLKDAHKKGIPPGARWTKIDRRLVNPAALEAGNERFEERAEYVIVLRVLSKEEIQAYAVKTQEIRDVRYKEYTRDRRRRREEERRRGRNDDSSTDDEDDSGDSDDDDTQFAIEGITEPNKDSSPPRNHKNSPSQAAQEPARAK